MTWFDESQNFALFGAARYLDKLDWEVHELAHTRPHQMDVLAFRSINCATTAWHMCDWVFADCERDPGTRSRLAALAHREIAKLADVQAWARAESRPVAICRVIATAGKHFKVLHHPDPSVRATYVRDEQEWFRHELVIHDGTETHKPHHVFVDALRFWRLALGWLELR